MGLDIFLGVLVLISALRGFFKGFFLQAIGVASLVACVYAADPLRDLARPYALHNFPKVDPDLMEKLLWWTAAVVACVVMTGVGNGLIKLSRRRPYGEPEPNRGDQGAGFVFGMLKGAVVVAFMAAGIQRYAPDYEKFGGWVGEQVKTSRALALSSKHRPAEKIWTSAPVQSFVVRVKTRGLWPKPQPKDEATETPLTTTAQNPRPKTLQIPREAAPLDPGSPDFVRRFDALMRNSGIRYPH